MSTGNASQPALTLGQIEDLTDAEVTALTAAAIAALTAADIAAFIPQEIAALTPVQIAAVSAAALAALTPADVAVLTAAQVAALAPPTIAALTPAQVAAVAAAAIAALAPVEITALTTAQIVALHPAQVAALVAAQVAALSPSDLAVLPIADVAVLSAAQAAALRPEQLPALTRLQIAMLAPAAIDALAPADIAALTSAQATALRAAQAAALQPAQIAALSLAGLAALSTADVAIWNAAQAAALRPLQIPALTQAQIAALSLAAIGALPTADIAALTPAQAEALTPEQAAALTPGQIGSLGLAALNALAASDMARLTATQAADLRPLQIPALTRAEISAMTAAGVGALTQADVAALSRVQAMALSPAVLGAIAPANLVALPGEDLAGLAQTQIGGLQPSQVAALTALQLAALPAVDLAALTSADVAALTRTQIADLAPPQVAGLTPAAIASLPAGDLSAFSALDLQALSTADLSAFTAVELQALTATQVADLLPAELAALSTAQIALLSATDIDAFSQTQVAALSAAQLAALVVPPPSPAATTGSGGGLTYEAQVPQPTLPGQVVGLVLQNPTNDVLAAREITFGMTFAQGQVPEGQSLVATVDGVQVAVQMDIKTTYADGSAEMAVLAMEQPQLAADSSVGVMLSLGGVAAPETPLSLAALADPGAYDFTVALTIQNANGTTTPYSFNAGALLAQALAAGTASYWLQGPLATQASINVPVTGSLYLTFTITRYADGSTSTDVQFNNDIAMSASGGTLVYDTTITQDGTVVLQQNDITEYQYQTWDQEFWSNGTPQVNVQEDIQALENVGAVQAYDLTNGVDTSLITAEAQQMLGAGFGILGNAGLETYMPTTGGRPDIGPTTEGNTIWLMTQNAAAAQYALAQAAAAGSIPWHLYDPTTGTYLMVTDNPILWADPRGGSSGTTGLTQMVPDYWSASDPNSGWAVDPAHEPDLDYVAYLLTGDEYYLDQLNAEASYDILDSTVSARLDGEGIVANTYTQVRTEAWCLREVVEAAYANPDGSAEKIYFTQIMDNNFQYLLQEAASVTAEEGDAFGYILWGQGNGWNGNTAPWQQDYFATTVVLAAEQGSAPAAQLLAWESNFLVGLFNSAAEGFSPYDGAAYQVITWQNGQWLTTWAQIEAATAEAGYAGGGTWAALAYPAYRAEGLSVLAGDFTVTQNPDALKVYGWLLAASGVGPAAQANNPTWDIVPRLPDGNYLDASNETIRDDTADVTIQGGNGDQLIFEEGSGNVTIIGGSGTNVLFAGSGNDTLQGGSGPDFLYGGAGTDVLAGGAGDNYMEAGTGATTFLLDVLDTAQDIIADFKVGIDQLRVISAAGTPDTAAQIAALIGTATQDSAGDAVLHLSASHTVTLQGIGVAALDAGLFG